MKINVPFAIEQDDPVLFRKFAAYITKVVTYAQFDYLRERKKYDAGDELAAIGRAGSYEDLPFGRGEFNFENGRLSEAFDGLNPLRRQILAFAFIDERPAQEIAERLGCSVDYVYLQKHRAIKALKDKLLKEGDTRGE